MAIFNKEHGHQYSAYLNWMYDDGFGRLDLETVYQRIWDFKTMGRAYLENSKNSLGLLLSETNYSLKADNYIFPVLFGIWQGLELVLKSGNFLCDLYLGETHQYKNHKIDLCAEQFLAKLKTLGFDNVERTHFSEMMQFINEAKENDAHFDFARYPEKSDGEKQFYNTADNSGYVKNLTVDMIELYRVLDGILDKAVDCVDFLWENLYYYGAEDRTFLNDEQLEMYYLADAGLKDIKIDNIYTLLEDNAKSLIEATKKPIESEKEKI